MTTAEKASETKPCGYCKRQSNEGDEGKSGGRLSNSATTDAPRFIAGS